MQNTINVHQQVKCHLCLSKNDFFSPKYMIRIPYKELVGNGNIINVSDRSLLFPCFTDHYLIKLDNKAPARDNFPLKKD